MIEKTGNHYKIFSYVINDRKYYFVTDTENADVIYGYKKYEDAEEMFERAENVANNIELWWKSEDEEN